MPNPYGYPTGPMMLPPGCPMPPGYAAVPGYTMQPGMPHPLGYPVMLHGYPIMPKGYPASPVLEPASPVTVLVAETAAPLSEQTMVSEHFAVREPPPSAVPNMALQPKPGIPPAPTAPPVVLRSPNGFLRLWRNIGGGSFTLSLLIHAGIILVGGLIVFTTTLQQEQVDFLPGGGTRQGAAASAALSHKVRQKRQNLLKKSLPKQRLVSSSMNAAVHLPDAPPDLLDVPDVSSMIGGGGKLGAGGGFGRGGAGGGFGEGFGKGNLGGITFKPLMMFGMELKDTRKIAVVMDVSRSMTRYLPIVAKELDKVARGSPLVLYFGCGLKTPPRSLEDKVRKVSDPRFDKFWYYWEGKHEMEALRTDYDKLKPPLGEPMPLEAVYNQMKNRSNTYFIDFNGIAYTSPALTCKEVMEADTLYWFADFQDAVDVEHIQDVMRKLRGRKQKLYMHASVRGNSFEIVRDELCLPLGGQVLETKVE